MSARFLFSVDLEDIRFRAAGGGRQPPRVPEMTQQFLDFLRRHRGFATFFVVGDVARAYPDLIRRIAADGHEIACHSDRHLPLERQDRAAFRDDLIRNLDALRSAGAGEIRGYRAPCFSLVERTRWAYEILAELGFRYSSSVLPARSPLYGWPSFGRAPREIGGVLELPVTLLPDRWLPVPMAGGVYFRILPEWLLRSAFRRRRERGEDVLGYFHPYDIDPAGARLAHSGFGRWGPGNFLLHLNRHGVLARLDRLIGLGFEIRPYRSCLDREVLEGDSRAG